MFTEEELKLIADNNGLCTLKELSEKLGRNYTNVSSLLLKLKIPFTPKRTERKYIKGEVSALSKKKNKAGELLLTDDLMKEWFF